jgi:hypothetical protein
VDECKPLLLGPGLGLGPGLAGLLHPVKPSEFLRRHFERSPLHREPTIASRRLAWHLATTIFTDTGERDGDGEGGGVAEDGDQAEEVSQRGHAMSKQAMVDALVLPRSWCACPAAPADEIDAVVAVAAGPRPGLPLNAQPTTSRP